MPGRGLRRLLGSVDAFGTTDFRPELASVTVPTLTLHGTADKPVPVGRTAQPAAKAIPQAKLVESAGASHGILVSERDRVASDLMAFLKG